MLEQATERERPAQPAKVVGGPPRFGRDTEEFTIASTAGDRRWLALAVGAGLQVMSAPMDADVTALAGPKGKHDPRRTAVRHGTDRGSVVLGGRRVPVERPRGTGGGRLG